MKRRKTLLATGFIALLALAGCNESGRPVSDGTAGPSFEGQAPIMGVQQGSTYVVAAGDTVATIADRTRTPVRTLIDLNNLQPPYVLKSGQRLALQPGASMGSGDTVAVGQSMVIPQATSNGSAAPITAPSGGVSKAALPPLPNAKTTTQAATQTATQATTQATTAPQVLQPAAQSAVQQGKAITTQSMTAANNAATTATQSATTAANNATNTAASTVNNAATTTAGKATSALPGGEPTVAIPDFPDASGKAVTATNTQVAAVTQAAPIAATGSGQFGWPVQGKIISKYGATADGLRNDGINISAPAGAPVVAAADGVVAYAGNELRGFGNMILIRHADGWVTAYAHNDSLAVKKGDSVKRGQTIARVGQTGNVTAPQLHFEIRKGTSAQDPMKYLGS
ncbi:MAG TPA: LysM peptidoglycan-binding domain-containing M23 family metallopeptidase [Dongiaceae bacterium]|nr:LysM peptidoglycan-binding domain-containing M23 family metallopeptidase [Dongiaceae bacterium]